MREEGPTEAPRRRGEARREGLFVRSFVRSALLLLLIHSRSRSRAVAFGERRARGRSTYLFDSALPQHIWSPAKPYLQGGLVEEWGREVYLLYHYTIIPEKRTFICAREQTTATVQCQPSLEALHYVGVRSFYLWFFLQLRRPVVTRGKRRLMEKAFLVSGAHFC